MVVVVVGIAEVAVIRAVATRAAAEIAVVVLAVVTRVVVVVTTTIGVDPKKTVYPYSIRSLFGTDAFYLLCRGR